MVSARQEIDALLEGFEPRELQQVLDFMRRLVLKRTHTPGRDLREFFGCMSHEDAEQMREALKDCSRIEPDRWDPNPFDVDRSKDRQRR
jgi:hypothetical protein